MKYIYRKLGRLALIGMVAGFAAACGEDRQPPNDAGADARSDDACPSGAEAASETEGNPDDAGETGADVVDLQDGAPDVLDSADAPAARTTIALPGNTFHPEGIAMGADGTMYVGSFTSGQITRTLRGETVASEWPAKVDGTTPYTGATGMIVDETAQVLWFCDPGGLPKGTQAASQVVGLRLSDGAVIATHTLGRDALCNDVTLDSAGNLYATDSYQPRIFRIPAADKATSKVAEAWATDSAWAIATNQPSDAGGQQALSIGLNGIDAVADGLWVGHSTNNAVYFVPRLADGTAGAARRLTLDRALGGPDGLKVARDGSLVLVEFNTSQLARIVLAPGDTGTVEVLHDNLGGPTTFALANDGAWVVQGQLGYLFGQPGSPTLPFKIVRVSLPAGVAR